MVNCLFNLLITLFNNERIFNTKSSKFLNNYFSIKLLLITNLVKSLTLKLRSLIRDEFSFNIYLKYLNKLFIKRILSKTISNKSALGTSEARQGDLGQNFLKKVLSPNPFSKTFIKQRLRLLEHLFLRKRVFQTFPKRLFVIDDKVVYLQLMAALKPNKLYQINYLFLFTKISLSIKKYSQLFIFNNNGFIQTIISQISYFIKHKLLINRTINNKFFKSNLIKEYKSLIRYKVVGNSYA